MLPVRRLHLLPAWSAVLALSLVWPGAASQPAAARGEPACLVLDLVAGRRLQVQNDALLRTPVLPGSVVKFVTLAAALDARVVTPASQFTCHRVLTIDGQRLHCSHPALGRPLSVTEALAYSCNDAFTAIASRLRRSDLDRTLLALGLPPSDASAPMATTGLGLAGIRATPEQWLTAFVRLAKGPVAGVSEDARRTVLSGLAGAAEFGTASVLGQRGLRVLAKTGTAPMPGGRFMGLVVVASPTDRPTRAVVVLAPGAAGADAAAIAADRLTGASPPARGPLRIGRVTASGRYAVEAVELEDYVARVVAAESAPASDTEALKALAVTVRTFALAERGRHDAEGFDLCDLTHCQVVGNANAATRAAAFATRGIALRDRGRPASVFYTASCGGVSERPSAVWPKAIDPAYLAVRREPRCREESRWTSEIRAPDLARALAAGGAVGEDLRGLSVVERSSSGRAARLAIQGFEPREVSGEAFRLMVGRALGWQLIKSTAFSVTRTAGGYRFDGSGAGHGVGLCVMGANRMAKAGRTWTEILDAYFPGVARARDGSGIAAVEIVLPAGEEGQRDSISDLVDGTVREWSGRFTLPVPAKLRLVFHPSVEAYARATGQPWWTAAATRGDRVDLLPPAVLRRRGIFERTLRHELAHVMAAEVLRGRPAWVQESAAMYLCGEIETKTVRGREGRTCPSDSEIQHPPSAAAMKDAYARAAACFAAQLRSGRRWDDVR